MADRFVALFGDLHNHCNISYGHGDLDSALANAALRLDFVSITGHAAWPDMVTDDPAIAHIVDFHEKGFAKLHAGWEAYCRAVDRFGTETGLIAFPGYEIHSNEHGDYTIVGYGAAIPLAVGASPAELRTRLAEIPPSDGVDGAGRALPGAFAFPHHIGYRQGARGINWETFDPALSPVVEIVSMHGMAESDDSDRPFLHSMGPLQSAGTMREGLQRGHRFGVIGNTDHHSGHPGSYGHGLAGVWAAERSRGAIWEALHARRTWALSGETVDLWFSVDGTPLGGLLPAASGASHDVEIDVDARSAIDYVELIVDGRRAAMWGDDGDEARPGGGANAATQVVVSVEVGWAERGKPVTWDALLDVAGARVAEVVPRFRGPEVVSPLDADGTAVPTHHASWRRTGDSGVAFRCTTWGNMTNTTPSTQGIAVRVAAAADTPVTVAANGARVGATVGELLAGSRSFNLGNIDSPAIRLSAVEERRLTRRVRFRYDGEIAAWAYARVRLRNGHWAVSSPVFAP